MIPRPRRAGRAAAVAAVIAVLLATCWSGPGAAATTGRNRQASRIRVDQVTPWVAADGDWTVRLSGMDAVPPGTVVRFTVHRQLSGTASAVRERIESILNGGSPGPSLQNEVRTTLLGPPPDGRYELVVPIRPRSGDESRLLLPNPGVHPVAVDVDAPDGTSLLSTTLFLNRLPTGTARGPLLIATTLDVTATAAYEPDGERSLDPEDLDRTADDLAVLEAARFPVTVALDPSLAAAMASSPDALEDHERLVDAVAPHVLARRTWVPIDLTRWSAPAALGEVRTQLAAGDRTLETLGRAERDTLTWPLDGTISPDAISALTTLGFERLLVSDGQLTRPAGAPAPSAALHPVVVRQGDAAVTALSTDPLAQLLLAEAPTDRDADGRRVNAAISTILAAWGATTGSDPFGALITFDAMAPERAVALAAALSEPPAGLVKVTDAAEVFEEVAPLTRRRGRSTELVVMGIEPHGSRIDGTALRRVQGVRTALAAYHSMVEEVPDEVTLDQRILLSEHRDFDAAMSEAALAEVEARIGAELAQITGPRDRSITLTARHAEIPLRIENGLDRPVEVQVRIDSSRVVVDGGSRQTIRLEPGTNRINLPVTVRTSGQFNVGVSVHSRDGVIELTSATIRVRSQVFSGVGILLGGGALAFLVVWWLVTHRRRRQQATTGPGEPIGRGDEEGRDVDLG